MQPGIIRTHRGFSTSLRSQFFFFWGGGSPVGCLITVVLRTVESVDSGASTTHLNPGSDAVPSRIVHFADLNLEFPGGRAGLYSRIKSAAQEVLVPVYFRITESSLTSVTARNTHRCGRAAVRSHRLTALHRRLTAPLTKRAVSRNHPVSLRFAERITRMLLEHRVGTRRPPV